MPDIDGIKFSFITDRLIVLLAYTLAIFGGWISLQFFPDYELLEDSYTILFIADCHKFKHEDHSQSITRVNQSAIL